MQIPLNALHTYIGIIVMTGLSIDILRRNRRQPNNTTLYFGLASFSAAISSGAYGIPALFTHDQKLLSIGTFISDILVNCCLLFLWFICIRAFLANRKTLIVYANTSVILLAIACMIEAIHRNLTAPFSATTIQTSNGSFYIEHAVTLAYQILTPINSLALILVSVYFFRQASIPKAKSQRMRLRGISTAFIVSAFAFTSAAFIPMQHQIAFTAIMFSSSFIIIAVTGTISLWMVPKEKAALKKEDLEPSEAVNPLLSN